MLDYSDIAALVGAGKTDAEIAAALAADPRTVRDIPVASLRPLIYVEWGLAVPDPVTGARSGPLIDLYEAADTPGELKAGVAMLLAHLADPTAEYVRTAARSDYAALWAGVVGLLGLSAGRLAVLDGLHGGPLYAGVTEADVAACRQEYERAAVEQEVSDLFADARQAAREAAASGASKAEAVAAGLAVIEGGA